MKSAATAITLILAFWGMASWGILQWTRKPPATTTTAQTTHEAPDDSLNRAMEDFRKTTPLAVGDTVSLRIENETQVLIATTESNYRELITLMAARDTVGLQQLVAADRALLVKAGTRAKLIERLRRVQPEDHFASRVRVEEGRHAGQDGFVDSNWVHAIPRH